MSLFYNSNIEINEKIFEPREETEKIVDITLKYLKDKMDILELGTGSGAISISLIKRMSNLNWLNLINKDKDWSFDGSIFLDTNEQIYWNFKNGYQILFYYRA